MTDELRRVDDDRYKDLDRKVDQVIRDVGSIRDMLISEPEASPLGRSLLKAQAENRALILDLRQDFEPVYDWWQRSRGAWAAILGLAVILGIVATFFGVLAYFQG